MSARLVRIWWVSQPPHPIARLTTASCNAKPSADEVSAATKPSSNSRHKSTKSIHDTTWAALGKFVALHKRVRAGGGRLALVNVVDTVYEVFAVTRLNQVLDVRPAASGIGCLPPLAS